MNVLFASNQAICLTHGGARTQIEQTKTALEKLGVGVTLLDMWDRLEPDSFDLLHVFTANIATYHLSRAVRLAGKPIVVSPIFYSRRSPSTVRNVVRLDRILNRFVRGFWTDYGLIAEMCGWASAVLPNSRDEATLLANGMGIDRKKIAVVHNGVEPVFASADPDLFRATYGITPTILCVTHVGPARKNVLRLIEALEGIESPAVIVGPVERSSRGMECLDRARQNPNLTMIESLPHGSPLLASAYASCEVFVLPSLFETPGIAALEAGLAGAKIVVTKHGGPREYFGDEAEYVDPASVEDIRRGIVAALAKPSTKELSARVAREFTWDETGRQTKALYDSVLSQ